MKLSLAVHIIAGLLSFNAVLAQEQEGTCAAQDASCQDSNTTTNDNDKINNKKTTKLKYRDTCRFYLAESSIPNAGFGIYTADDIPNNEELTQVADAPSIIVTDAELHNGGDDANIIWNHVDYFWDGSGGGEFEADIVEESVVTFGSLCNYHTYLKNVKPDSHEYVDNLTPRNSGSPGMGAYSYQPGFIFKTTRGVEAGEEIFCDYGPQWLDTRSFGNYITREDEYDKAGDVILKTIRGLQGNDLNDSVLKTIKSVVQHFDSRTSKILPESKEQIKSFGNKKHLNSDEIAMSIAKNTVTQRSMDWIKENGQCIDNLVPQLSTLPHAGNGAFAQRLIRKGELVAPAPLLQIMDYNYMRIFDFQIDKNDKPSLLGNDNEDNRDEDGDEVPVAFQLLLNYCMSHSDTTMLMCPQTNVILMNHCSTRVSYGGDCEKYNSNPDENLRGANTELKWATDWDPDTKEWLDLSIDQMKVKVASGKRGLSLDIIATRDIYPGEEVFLDYGRGWEEDWEEHVETFLPPDPDDHYLTIKEMNDDLEANLILAEDLEENPYPDNASLACIYWPAYNEIIDEESPLEDYKDWKSDGSIFHVEHADYKYYGILTGCDVLEMTEGEDGEVHITVEIYSSDGLSIWAANNKPRILYDYPMKSLSFVPAKYTSDQHLVGAFRSYIRIPDEIFPEHWKDLEE